MRNLKKVADLKKRLIAFSITALVLYVFWWSYGIPMRVDPSFASSVRLGHLHFDGHEVSQTVIRDSHDIKLMEELLSGWAINTEEGTAYFDSTTLITFTNGRKSITFWTVDRDTHKYLYLSDEQKKALTRICKKYDVIIR